MTFLQLTKNQKFIRIMAVVLVLGSVIINIKNIFTSCQVDAEYQVVMAYRILQGDKLFSQMWEAHQTSAFFLAFFEWFFIKTTGSTTGIMVFANSVGIICKTVIAFCVYQTYQKYIDKKVAFAVLLFVLNTYPKDVVLPDFANLQIWFGLLLMCCLICYFERHKKRWLVLGAICLCLEVLAYPSCVLIWPLCLVLIGMYSSQKWRDMCIFTGVCGIGAVSYLIYFMRGNPQQFMQHIYYIWSGDETHAVGLGDRLALLGPDFLLLILDIKHLWKVIASAAFAFCVCWMISKSKGRKWTGRKMFYMALSWFLVFYILRYLVHLPAEDVRLKPHFFILYVFVAAAAWVGSKYLESSEKRIFVIGQLVGIGGFVATSLLSDLGMFCSLPYFIPGMCACILPISRLYKEDMMDKTGWKCFIPAALICAVMIIRNFIYLNGWMNFPVNFYQDSILGVNTIIKYGPLKGMANIEWTYATDTSYLEWQNIIHDGDRVLVISHPSLNATVYLYKDVEICADSTISSPTYSERLLTYWEENPDKYPNVVVLRCTADGVPMMGEYNRVTQWLEEEFSAQQVIDTTYWKFFLSE